jgi:hypothetical protein
MFELFEIIGHLKTFRFVGKCNEYEIINCYLYLEETIMNRKYWNRAMDSAFLETQAAIRLIK